jgi:hypothetical protein
MLRPSTSILHAIFLSACAAVASAAAPSLQLSIASSNANPAFAKDGNTVTLTIVASQPLAGPPTVLLDSNLITVTGSGINFTATHTVSTGTTSGFMSIDVSNYQDLSSNFGPQYTSTTDGSKVTVDLTNPSIIYGFETNNPNPRAEGVGWAKEGDTITVTLFASEPIAVPPTVEIAGSNVTLVQVSPTEFKADLVVTSSTPEGDASVFVSSFADFVGNIGDPINSPSTIVVDRTTPTVELGISTGNASGSHARLNDTVIVSIVAAEPLYVLPDVLIAGATATDYGSSSATNFGVAIFVDNNTPEGIASLSVTGVRDLAGNSGAAMTATTDGSAVTVDRTAPVTAATISQPAAVGNPIVVPFATEGALLPVLFVKRPGELSFSNAAASLIGGDFQITGPSNGSYEFYTIGTDLAGNVEVKSAADDQVIVNLVANGALTLSVTGNGTYLFPMETGLTVEVTLTGVTTRGTLTISRMEGNNSPGSLDAANLIDQSLVISAGGGLVFGNAEVVVPYDPTLLGGLTPAAITTAFRDASGVVTSVPATVDSIRQTITFQTTGFSNWYFGPSNATAADWIGLAE